ncbi:MAG TPA: NAD-dependent epimerase/dehydratase family protein [Alphaproteobacteria bacterium]
MKSRRRSTNGSGGAQTPVRTRQANGGGNIALITGGAGFLGCNLADRLASEGCTVIIYDSLARPEVEKNIVWLQHRHGSRIQVQLADIRDARMLSGAVAAADLVFHFAAQVAVTTSLVDPIGDFEINARGTLNLLEALRARQRPIPLVFASTNKVYGTLEDVVVTARATRYEPLDPEIARHGVSERQPLSLYSPYGCSKGAADQYVLDYARMFGLPTVVFRMSCLYGPHQFGTEDQGWVAHFAISMLTGRPITIYGDGRQVRDILFIDDVLDAYLLAASRIERVSGQAFNIGGGPANAISLLELLDDLGQLTGRPPKLRHGPARAGDQQYYVSDTRKFAAATGWHPTMDARTGVRRLVEWLETRHRPAATLESERLTA